MKQWIFIFISFILIIGNNINVYASENIAVVNITSIIEKLPDFEISMKKIENELKERIEKIQSMERDLKEKFEYFHRNSPNMKANERYSLEKSLYFQREIFINSAQSLEQDHYHRQQEEKDKILKKILELVKNIAKEDGYSMVIDTNSIAYVNLNKDITEKIMQRMQ